MKNHHIALVTSLILTAMPLTSVAKPHFEPKIIGGEEAAVDAWPFMTALVSKDADAYNGQSCGASLISNRYVLTASHCVEGASSEQLDVIVGIHDLNQESSQGQRIAVKNILMHENYSMPVELNNDIAILELAEEVTGVEPIKPITLEIMQALQAGQELTVIGWGNRSVSGQDFPNILHQVNIPLYDRAECEAAYPGLTEQMICAGFPQGGKDSCQGDSGGPLVVRHQDELYQIGVVSFGDGCAVAGKPGVYANVSAFDSWITQKTSGVSMPALYPAEYVEQGYQGEHQFTLTNLTAAPLTIGNALVGEVINVNNPQIAADSCSGSTLAVNAECHVKVSFSVPDAGDANLKLQIDTAHSTVSQVTSTIQYISLPAVSFDSNHAMDSENVRWFTSSESGWTTQVEHFSKGESALVSGSIADAQSTVLLAIIDNATGFSIDYKTSTEQDYDYFNLYIDGLHQFAHSGQMNAFESKSFELGEGQHRILFTYVKDAEVSENDDKVYLDNLSISSANHAPTAAVEANNLEVEEGSVVSLNAESSRDADNDVLVFAWTQLSGATVELAQSDSAIASFTAPQVDADTTLTFQVTVTDVKGASSQQTVTVKVKAKADAETGENSSGGGSIGICFAIALLLLTQRKYLAKNK